MSSQRSRTIIRTHHRLQKEHAAAAKQGDTKLAEQIARAIENNGGLQVYQAASKQGQASKVLVEWLQEAGVIQSRKETKDGAELGLKSPLRCLEVGALSTKNEISRFPQDINMTRIDLNSQGPGITKQDFMERPLPTSSDEAFDVVSLSLVLNYAPDPVQRGEMLKRVTRFLGREAAEEPAEGAVLPVLFLVLPLPCVDNSRYLNEQLLMRIMTNLGFTVRNKKKTSKLCYYLFSLTGKSSSVKTAKKKIKDGATMNNFCIVVE
jgi:25S rRNA (adenine2142-N1)-methyltransferase